MPYAFLAFKDLDLRLIFRNVIERDKLTKMILDLVRAQAGYLKKSARMNGSDRSALSFYYLRKKSEHNKLTYREVSRCSF